MSDYMTLRCATCDEDSGLEESKSGYGMRELATVAPVLAKLESYRTGCQPLGDILECYVVLAGHSCGIEWLAAHADHELVVVSEYGPVVWSNKRHVEGQGEQGG